MERVEAVQLLKLMQATWPSLAADDVSARLWRDDLEKCDSGPAIQAFRLLRDGSPHRPAWSDFLTEYQSVKRRETQPRAIEASRDDFRPDNDERERVQAMIRKLADKMGPRWLSRKKAVR